MRQSKKLLSVLLAITMVFSIVAVSASATASPWKDSAIENQYNNQDKPVLTTQQYATAALDEVDRMLAKEEMKFTQDDILVGELDLTSIDAALNSVVTLVNGSLWQQFKGMLGDLYNLSITALSTHRRASSSSTDLDVIYSLLQFLYDNKQLFVDFVSGDIDLGSIVGMFINLDDFSIPDMAKGFIYEFAYGVDAPSTITESVDVMAQKIIDDLVVGTVENPGLLPSLDGHTNISTGSTYDFIDNALKIVYNDMLVPMINEQGIPAINEMLAKYPDEIAAYKKYFNLTPEGTCDFTIPEFAFTSASFISQINNILGSIINLAISDELDFTWESGSNSKIVDNIIEIGKKVLVNTGDAFFASYIETKTPEELATMTDMEICAYVARTIINSSVRGLWIPNTAETLIEVANYTLKGIMATEVPSRDYSSESTYPNNSINTTYAVGADLAVKFLNEAPGLGLSYGISIDQVVTEVSKWAITNYGGLLGGVNLNANDSGWVNLDKIIFSIINKNWLDATQFPNGTVTLESLVKNIIIENVINLDFDSLFTLIETNPAGSELNSAPKQVLLNIVSRTINIVFPGLLSTSMTSFDDIISATNLSNTVNALFSNLYNNRVSLVAAVLPIVCDMLDLTTAQEFKAPSFDFDNFNYVSTGSSNLTFTITNPSSGVNTGYTDANGVFHQDSRYSYKIQSVALDSSVATLSISQPANKVLNGGDSVSVNITGAINTTASVIVKVTYDVLTETGATLTSQPMTARVYSYISKTDTDENSEATNTNASYPITGGDKNVYTTSVKGLDDLSLKFKNNSGADIVATPYSATSTNSVANLSFVQTRTDSVTILSKAQVSMDIYEITEAYTGTAEQDLEAFTANGYRRYQQTAGATMGATTTSTATNIILYKDYGLIATFNSEVNAQRQSYDYTDTAVWNAYLTAMNNASALVNGKKTATTFCLTTAAGMANKFEGVATALETAIENLEAVAAGGGIDSTIALMEQVSPSNEGLVYTDPDYSFFGSGNFVAYTYSNFRDEYKAASKFVDSNAIRDELGEYVLDADGNKTYGAADSLSVAFKNHRLSLYYGRLLSLTSEKAQLNKAITAASAAGYVAENYTEESYEAYTTALAFANSVKNEADPVQNKINTAYIELVEAQKRLIKAGSEEPGEIVITTAAQNPGNAEYAPEIYTNSLGENILLGVYPENIDFSIEDYFVVTGGEVTFVYDSIATGEVVQILDSSNNVVYEFVISITGDINGSGDVDISDLTTLSRFIAGFYAISETSDTAFDLAADLNASGDVDVSDLTTLSRFASGAVSLNYAARAVA